MHQALACKDEDTLYLVYLDGNDLFYTKSANGGGAWGAPVTIDNTGTITGFTCWYDKWARGATTGRLHVAWKETTTTNTT